MRSRLNCRKIYIQRVVGILGVCIGEFLGGARSERLINEQAAQKNTGAQVLSKGPASSFANFGATRNANSGWDPINTKPWQVNKIPLPKNQHAARNPSSSPPSPPSKKRKEKCMPKFGKRGSLDTGIAQQYDSYKHNT